MYPDFSRAARCYPEKKFEAIRSGQIPFQHQLDIEPGHAQSQSGHDHEGTEFTGFGLPCQVADDEQHKSAKAEGHAKVGDLFFRVAKHEKRSRKLFSAILTHGMLRRNN